MSLQPRTGRGIAPKHRAARRRDRRRWSRRMVGKAPVETLLAALPSLPRAMLERITERLIDQLDVIDGDPELEDDDIDEEDDHHGSDAIPIKPQYGIDQTTRPINEAAAYREWQRSGCPDV